MADCDCQAMAYHVTILRDPCIVKYFIGLLLNNNGSGTTGRAKIMWFIMIAKMALSVDYGHQYYYLLQIDYILSKRNLVSNIIG